MAYDDRRSGESPSTCTQCGVDFTSARHWADFPSESAPEKCNLCAHDDEETTAEPLMSRAKKWLKMESNADQRIKATQHGRGGSSWPSRVEPPSCWGCGNDYLSRWSPEDLAQHPHEDNAPICPDCYEEAGIEESYYKRPSFIKSQTLSRIGPLGFTHSKTRSNAGRGTANIIHHDFTHPDGTTVRATVGKMDGGMVYDPTPTNLIGSPAGYGSGTRTHRYQGEQHGKRWVVNRPGQQPQTFSHLDDLVNHLSPKQVGAPGGVELIGKDVPINVKMPTRDILQKHGWKLTRGADSDRSWDTYHHDQMPGHHINLHSPDKKYNYASIGIPSKSAAWKGHVKTRLVNNDKLDAYLKDLHNVKESVMISRRTIIEQVLEKNKEKKPYNPMPEGPKDVNPFEIHNYFMQMADWHEKEGRKHGQLGTFKPLFSRDRKHHDNRSQFHSQMQMAFAQKALDALNFQQQPDKPGVREALETMLHEMAHLSEARDIGSEWKKELAFRKLKNTPRVSPETHIRSMKGTKVPPPDAPEDVDPREWSRVMKLKKTESTIPSQVRLNNLKHSHPNTFKHLMDRSREARLNTGEADGEYGTYHHLATVPPSKLKGALDHALVYHTATALGPDMDYKLAGRLTAKVRKSVPNGEILGAFEKGELHKHVEPLIRGPQSDRYRHDADKYY